MKNRPLLTVAALLCFGGALPASAAGPPPPALVTSTPITSTPITITVQPGARQTFRGTGASIFPWTPSAAYKAQVTSSQNAHMARLLWHDARLHSVRLWIHPGEEPVGFYVDGYVRTGKLPAALAAGATDLILAPDHIPSAMNDGHGLIRDAEIPNYAALLAGFIAQFRAETGILINHCGVLNEPNDRPVKFSDAQWPVMIKALRAALDARGLRAVGIVAPEAANCGGDAYDTVDAITKDPAAAGALQGVATHSYNNAATEDMARRALAAHKDYWVTEAGGITDADEGPNDALQAASVASRFLNDLNHGVTHWQFFIGALEADPRGNTGRILKYDPQTAAGPFRLTVLQKYYYLKQLGEAFDVGARPRHCLSSLDGEMTYTYGKKPRVTVAAARNPDGTWAVGVSNYTSPTFTDADDAKDFAVHNSGYAARTFAVTVRIPELASAKTLRFAVRRSTGALGDVPGGLVVMRYGVAVVPAVAPLELITLRALKVVGHTKGTR